MILRFVLLSTVLLTAFGVLALWRRSPSVERLDLETLGKPRPAIVQFGTPQCVPCRQSRPHLERAAFEAGVEYVEIDLAERPELASRYRIRSVPFVVVAREDGVVVGRWTGVPDPEEVQRVAASAGAS